MADEAYTYSAVYYPRAVAMARLPMGLPAGLGVFTGFQSACPRTCLLEFKS